MKHRVAPFFNYIIAKLPVAFIPFGIGLFVGEIIIPNYISVLSLKDQLIIISPFIGWVIAFCSVIIQINSNRKNNDEIKRKEIKQKFQIEAFKQINNAIIECSKIYTEISWDHRMLPAKLKTNSENPNFDFNSFILPFYSYQYSADIHKGYGIFKRAIEANEIAIMEFKHLDTKIFLEITHLLKLIDIFRGYIGKNSQSSLLYENYEEFDFKSKEIAELVLDIQCYLHDFRIFLMNSFLGDIFNTRVPNREPFDKNIKTLNELSKDQEKVEKEFRELERSLAIQTITNK